MKLTKRILSAVLALSLTAGGSLPAVSAYDISEAVSVSSKTDIAMEAYASEYRKHLVNRETEFSISVSSEFMEDMNNVFKMISLAVKDTPESSAVEGDYLAWVLSYSNFNFKYNSGQYDIITKMDYNTTAEQETELDKKVTEILDKLNVYSASDYEKIKAVHDYVIENVSYHLSNDMIYHTAYGAGINGEAVCQGYSLLMYRLLSELGINVRCVPGDAGGPHMWNMVELYGKYYYIDATFDDGMINKYAYFLKGSQDFDEYDKDGETTHIFNTDGYTSSYYADYTDGDFLARFDISPTAYDPSAPVVTNPAVITAKPVVTTTAVTVVPPVTTTVGVDYVTQLEYDRSPMKVGETREVYVYNHKMEASSGISVSGIPSNVSTELKNSVLYVTAVKAGKVQIYVRDKDCAFGEYVYLTIEDDIFGDMDGDGIITANDASAVLMAYGATATGQYDNLTDGQRISADVNKDGKIDASDASIMLSYYAYTSTTGDEVETFEDWIASLE